MRPVLPGVEVADTEGEVHRVDVFESGRERRDMPADDADHHEQHRDQARPAGRGRRRPVAVHEIGLSSSGSFKLPCR